MRIALIGYGKMGVAIEEIALRSGHTIALKINSANLPDFTIENLQSADVAIEFTTPHSAAFNIIKCFEAGLPVVSGSTGWLDDLERVKELCLSNNTALLYASNFSVGVNIFFELNTRLAALMNPREGYAVNIEEIHHTHKKDAPSGTAITLAEQVLDKIDYKSSWVNHPSENISELTIISKRIDPAPGTHIVKYESSVDSIEITHTAFNRRGFATGAVMAAEFIEDKQGIFSMKDVLGL